MSFTLIIGAGSSGCVLAARLTEDSAREVLLLEAGPDRGADLPRDLSDGRRNSMVRHDWGYKHRPSPQAIESALPRGRVVGGSSAVNTCIALRGQPEDYDEWAALGLSEWSFERCLPAFKKLERDLDFKADYHGDAGPLPVRRHTERELVPIQAAFIEACRELGWEECKDSNEPGKAGFGPHAMNKVEGRRISAAEAYLTPAVRARPNLRIRADVLVRRVLFRNKRAIGVELETAGGVERIDADEVIVCAGAINTPGILLRSGVGPDREVRALQCEPVIDAPAVAHRLLDHPGTGIFVLAKRGFAVDFEAPIIQCAYRFPSGELDHRADMLLQPASFTMLPRKPPLFGLVTQVGKPRGTGRMRYPDAGTRTRPIIEQHFFANAWDRKLARDSLQRCHAILKTRAFSNIGRAVLPWSAVLASDRWLERFIPYLCDSGYHPAGTVPMGVTPSDRAAVDPHGRVFGAEGLYVIDASLMPTIPSSNIHLPTLMVAERMAEWIRAS